VSVTITINNNHKFVDSNCPELIQVEIFDKDIDPDQVEYKNYPFELNIANGNFASLWQALGLYTDDCYSGEISPKILLAYLNQLSLKRVCTPDEIKDNFYTQGIDLSRASRYYWNLMQITKEAIKRNELIVWC
jgi:hypothetical protein